MRSLALLSLALLAACGTPAGRDVMRTDDGTTEAPADPVAWRPDDGLPPELALVARALAEASRGEEASAVRALELARGAVAEAPEAPIATAYLGGATAIQARFTGNPLAKLSAAREGTELLDRAVAAAPEDVEVRFLRAISTFPMPTFLGRGDQTTADLRWLSGRTADALRDGRLTPRMAALIHLYDGIDRREDGDLEGARAAFAVAAAWPGCLAGRRAAEQLAALDPER